MARLPRPVIREDTGKAPEPPAEPVRYESKRSSCRWCLKTLSEPVRDAEAFCSDLCRSLTASHEYLQPGDLNFIPRTSHERSRHRAALKRKNYG